MHEVLIKNFFGAYLPFSVDAVIADAKDVIEVLQTIRVNGEGVDAWCNWLLEIKRKERKFARKLLHGDAVVQLMSIIINT